MKVKEESAKAGLKLNTQKTKNMTSGPITSQQIVWEIVETVTDFIILVSKITADGWLQPWNWKMLAPWKKSCDQPRQHMIKQRHYFADKSPSSQSYGFSSSQVWMWELVYKESWVLKNWCFWTVMMEKTVPCTEKRYKLSILKEISPEYLLEGLMLKLKLHYFGPWYQELAPWKIPWCWERLKVGGEVDNRGWDDGIALLT